MTNANLTGILMILDRSGSMQTVKTDTEGGFNSFIEDQRQVTGDTRVTLVQFDDKFETVYTDIPIHDVPPLTLHPRGMTALHDAIGRGVAEYGERLATLSEDQRPGQVFVVILTDGQENSSQEYTGEQVKTVVTDQSDKYGWHFTYLGANQDAVLTGTSLGITRGASLTYTASDAGTKGAFSAVGDAVTRSRSGGGSINYTDKDRDSAAKQ